MASPPVLVRALTTARERTHGGLTLFPDGGDSPGPVTGFTLPTDGTHSFMNSKTYRPDAPPDNRLSGIEDLWIQANDRERPHVSLVPGNNAREWVVEAASKVADDDVRCLTLEGLWIGLNPDGIPDEALANPDDACTPVEAVLAIEGEFDRVLIRHCTFDPGGNAHGSSRARARPSRPWCSKSAGR